MPVVTGAQRHKLNREPVLDAHIVLLEFQEDGRSAIARLAANTADVVHNGNTYFRANVQVQLPHTSSDDTRASLTVSNINRVLGRVVDASRQRINVRMILVDSSDLDTAILDTRNLIVMPQVSGNSVKLTCTLGPRVSLQEPAPFQKTTKSMFPGVWLAS